MMSLTVFKCFWRCGADDRLQENQPLPPHQWKTSDDLSDQTKIQRAKKQTGLFSSKSLEIESTTVYSRSIRVSVNFCKHDSEKFVFLSIMK